MVFYRQHSRCDDGLIHRKQQRAVEKSQIIPQKGNYESLRFLGHSGGVYSLRLRKGKTRIREGKTKDSGKIQCGLVREMNLSLVVQRWSECYLSSLSLNITFFRKGYQSSYLQGFIAVLGVLLLLIYYIRHVLGTLLD